jgi:hypothetical protein
VVQPGLVGCDELQLVVLLVGRQQDLSVGSCPLAQVEHVGDVLDRAIEVGRAQGDVTDVHAHQPAPETFSDERRPRLASRRPARPSRTCNPNSARARRSPAEPSAGSTPIPRATCAESE